MKKLKVECARRNYLNINIPTYKERLTKSDISNTEIIYLYMHVLPSLWLQRKRYSMRLKIVYNSSWGLLIQQELNLPFIALQWVTDPRKPFLLLPRHSTCRFYRRNSSLFIELNSQSPCVFIQG